jgi:uncharacterized membrane protein
MKDIYYAVVVAEFQEEKDAELAFKNLKAERKEKALTIQDAAIIRKAADGKLHVKETADSGAGKGAGIGLLAGGAIGLISGPIGLIAWGAAGALAGGVAAKLRDSGIKHAELSKIGEELQPGSSGLVVVFDPKWTTLVEQELTATGAKVSTTGIAAEIAEQLHQAAAEKEARLDGGLVSKEGVDSFTASTQVESRSPDAVDKD